ncbi:DNA polymerase III subunit alpha [Ureibacillus terrenus]|uniref:DNA polymerase III subunit alpha n=1 Tax=Ureibacillus terrenus TaxID=118246 RepID=UPI002E22D912|nr:DNA polymerase III subunit alpha [Ureibacillus terrenus]
MSVYPQVRTSADLLKSTIRLEELIPFLVEQKAEACAIVNSKLYGLLPFYHGLKKAGIHPVAGLSVQVRFEGIVLPLLIYAQNNDGYKNLLKISSSIAITEDEQLPFKWLKGYSKGICVVIPADKDHAIWLKHVSSIEILQGVFRGRIWIGVSRGEGEKSPAEDEIIRLGETFNIPIMALHECLYLKREDAFSYRVARSIDQGIKLSEQMQMSEEEHHYTPTGSEWMEWFHDHPEWLEESRKMLSGCHADIESKGHIMPKYPLPAGQSAEKVLKALAIKGLKERLKTDVPDPVYLDRLDHELEIICSMGFADYFLIVADFMNYAREQRILTGPGRGSSVGSLVAYSLYITQVDPIRYGLLFERFLNPERVSMPDIDIDFVDTRRHEVIQYVAKKYGEKHVAQIITFGTLSAKAVARDVARMFNFEPETLEMISRLIPNRLGITLIEAYDASEPFRKWIGEEPIRKRWFETALKLEGLPRNASTHAAGVVLCPMPLVEVVPIEKGHDGIFITQWPMQEVEQMGLLKMDFLGLRNLTMIEQILKMIHYNRNIYIDLNEIPLDDRKTFELLQHGDTLGIFQLESEGMRNALREIVPTRFSDIVAVNALYRPGPMQFIPVYARRKKGLEPVVMPHPDLEPILGETYGIIVYQEQIMQIAHRLAGFSLGQADLLRRAVSKKKREVLEEQRKAFVNGAVKNGYGKEVAESVYEQIVRFADYGFAKSHAVAYSMISYQMAYLKANFPLEFYAVMMTFAAGNQERLFSFIVEARSKGITVLRPSLHKSSRGFTVENGKIRYGLSAISGLSQSFLQKLIQARKEQGEFHDLFDLAVSLSGKHFNRKSIESLIKAGVLDDFGKDRATLLATIEAAEKHAKIARPTDEDDLFASQTSLFGKPKYQEAEPMPDKIKLQFEKEVFGFYLSEHPATNVRKRIQVNTNTLLVKSAPQDAYVKLVGMVESIHQIRTKKGELMAFVQVQDEFGAISATIFPKLYNDCLGWIKEDAMVYMEGKVQYRFNQPQIVVKIIKFIQ